MTDNNLHPLYPMDSNKASKMSLSKQRLRVWLRLLDRNRDIQNRLRISLRDDFDMTLPRFDVMATLNWQPEGLRMSAGESATFGRLQAAPEPLKAWPVTQCLLLGR